MSSVLNVSSLYKEYDSTPILKNVNFDIKKGETLGLVGKSGSGKTTLGRCIAGLEKPTRGEINFNGKDVLSMRKKELSKIRPKIQMIFQHPETSLNPRMKGIESICEPLKIHTKLSKEEMMGRVQEMIDMVGLRMEHLQRYPTQLSGGEIQRIVLARIMSMQPDLIVADEPTSMLDVSVQAQILRLMENVQSETDVSYLLVSHDIGVLEQMCDRIAYLENGSISSIEQL